MTALKRPSLLILSATAFAPPMVEKSPETASLASGAAARASRQRSSFRPCKTTSWPCAIRSLAAISPRPSEDPVMKTRAITFLPDDHSVSADWSACIEANCVVPEQLALSLRIHLPHRHDAAVTGVAVHDHRDRHAVGNPSGDRHAFGHRRGADIGQARIGTYHPAGTDEQCLAAGFLHDP